MKFIQGCGAFAAMVLAISSLVLPSQAQTPVKYGLSVICRVAVSVKPTTGDLTSCRPAMIDGLSMMVNAGDTVTFRASGPVANWTGCTVESNYPPVSICSMKMTGPKTVANFAPAAANVAPTASPKPPASTTGGPTRF
jgi:hypothetical protein